MKRTWLVVAALASLGALGAAIPLAFAESASPSATTRITFTATDFRFRATRTTAPAGPVVITLVNRGTSPHDLRIGGKRTSRIGPGKRATLRLNLTTPGRLRFVCTVPGHAALGMRGTFVVTKPAPTVTSETTE